MQNQEIFNFLKGILMGLDINNDSQYQKAIRQISSNPLISYEQKIYYLNQIENEYRFLKEQNKQGKNIIDFSEFISKLVNHRQNF